MTVINPYFAGFNEQNEQDLIEDLIIESIEIYGVPVYYLPRTEGNPDPIFGEDPLSQFTEKYEMPMYMKTIDNWGGNGEFISKFGIRVVDTCTLTVANKVFDSLTDGTYEKPREGDWIYMPLSEQMYEVSFVEKEAIFYQLGRLNCYDLKCELVEFSHESVSVSEPDIDELINSIAFTVKYTMSSSGAGTYRAEEFVYQGTNLATATAKGTVVSYNSTTRVLELKDIYGVFALTTATKGNTSGANRQISSFDIQELPNDPIATNQYAETQSDTIVVSTSNPLRR